MLDCFTWDPCASQKPHPIRFWPRCQLFGDGVVGFRWTLRRISTKIRDKSEGLAVIMAKIFMNRARDVGTSPVGYAL